MELTPDGQFTQPEITTSSCEATLACARTIFTLGFSEFNRNASDNLIKLVELFTIDINKINKNILTDSMHLDTEENWGYFNSCKKFLTPYTTLAQLFYNMVDQLDQMNKEINKEDLLNVTVQFETYVYRYTGQDIENDFKREVLKNCFWFERLFWWRFTTLSNCYSNSIKEGITPDRNDSLRLAELDNKLSLPEQLQIFCNLDEWNPLVLMGEFIIFIDPCYVPFNMCRHRVLPKAYGLTPVPSAVSSTIIGPTMLDPNDPIFQVIEKISCYFYPITNPELPTHENIQHFYDNFQSPLLELSEYKRILQNISDTLKAYKSGSAKLKKSQIAKFTLHPNVNKKRIEGDFRYYQNLLTKNSETIEKVFSKFEIYGHIFPIFNTFTRFSVAALEAEDFLKVDLLKQATELGAETMDIKRCFEGEDFHVFFYYLYICIWNFSGFVFQYSITFHRPKEFSISSGH